MQGTFTIPCPKCKVGRMEIEYWFFPGSYEEPPDEGSEIKSANCTCYDDVEWDDELTKILELYLELNDLSICIYEHEMHLMDVQDDEEYEKAREALKKINNKYIEVKTKVTKLEGGVNLG